MYQALSPFLPDLLVALIITACLGLAVVMVVRDYRHFRDMELRRLRTESANSRKRVQHSGSRLDRA